VRTRSESKYTLNHHSIASISEAFFQEVNICFTLLAKKQSEIISNCPPKDFRSQTISEKIDDTYHSGSHALTDLNLLPPIVKT